MHYMDKKGNLLKALTIYSILQVIYACNAPTNITDSTYSPEKTEYADAETVTYTCNTGYELSSGDPTLTCNNSTGLWEGTPPVCSIVTCAAPATVLNSQISADEPLYNYSAEITYICDIGYEHTSGDLIRTCTASSAWSGSAPVCSTVTWAEPTNVPDSSRSEELPYYYNTSLTYSCDLGYELSSDDSTITCSASGTWSGAALSCSLVTCATPASVPDSSRSQEPPYYYNDNLTYTCDLGYELSSGDATRICTASGIWSGTAPTCSPVTCSEPASVPHSSRSQEPTYHYNDDLTYTCDLGYEFTSGDAVRTCTASGTWSGTAPTCSLVTCADPASVPSSSRSEEPPYYYNDDLAYTCDLGYELSSGDAIRTCTASGIWSGTAPTCALVTCAEPASVPDSSRSQEPPYYYHDDLTYTCDLGYELSSGDAIRNCTAGGTWSGTAPTCSLVTCAEPTSVPDSSRSQEPPYYYDDALTYACDQGYDLSSGDATRTCTDSGTWSGTAPTCSLVTCSEPASVPDSSRSEEPPYYYSDDLTYTCDLGYELSSGDATRTCTASGTWSGTAPTCSLVTCAAPASVSDSTKSQEPPYYYNDDLTYTCDPGYELSSGDSTRTCTASGTWSGIAPTCSLVTCSEPANVPDSSRSQEPTYYYNSDLTYTCDPGYELSGGDATRTCTASGTWSGVAPTCSIVTCVAPASVSDCSVDSNQATYNYSDTIVYTCNVGFEKTSGDLTRACQADSSWSGSPPVCTSITCAEVIVPNSLKSPDTTSYAFNSTVTYACETGYELASGDLERTCTAIDVWSGAVPVCSIITCPAVVVVGALRSPNQATYDYNTGVTYSCDTGYEYAGGDLTRTCKDDTTWSGTEPACAIVTCAAEDISRASRTPNQTEYDYNTDAVYSCDVGFYHSAGDLTRTCLATRTWSGVAPTCTLVTCNEVVIAHSSKDPDLATYNYTDIVNYTCDTGYELTAGILQRMCTASGTWAGTAPTCSIKTCTRMSVDHADPSPDQPTYDYNTDVTYTCHLAYNHTDGDLTRTCNSSAEWTGTLPTCTVAACIEEDGMMSSFTPTSPSTLHNFDVNLTYTCDTGYNHSSGDLFRTCQNNGQWTGTAPTCTIVTCDHPPVQDNTTQVSPTIQAEYDYQSDITYECNLAYNHTSGDLVRTCQADATWSGQPPVCLVAACIQEGADNSTFTPDSPSTLHDFGDSLTYVCDTGHNHSLGDLVRTCQANGQWSGDLPTCPIVTCSQPPIPSFTTITPIQTEYIYLSVITVTCDLGYNRTNGDETRTCDENAQWTGDQANCTLVTCEPPPAVPNMPYSPDLPVYNYSDSITFACDEGYLYGSGDVTRSCNEHAQWTGVAPSCTIIQCEKIVEPNANRSPKYPFYDYNTSVTYKCETGYNLTAGDSERWCDATGNWKNTPPNCTIVECDPPDPVIYASWTPIKSIYVYQDTLTYSCNLGYERTSGDETRSCDPDGLWTNTAPDCTIIHCTPPTNGTFTTFTPDEADYIWNDTVDYTCIHGYNYSSGDLHRECEHDKTWSGITPICSVITCDKVDIDHMTFSPPTLDTHDYGTTIVYSCDVGYNYSYGDLSHTCTETREWTGVWPNCTIITCDPPAAIPHTMYTPNNLTEHNWNTAISYTCDADYHYISGIDTTTCNETGEFPPVDFDCSAQHYLTIDPGEPSVTVINPTVNTANINFDFDGMCNVAVQVVPDGLDASLTSSGTVITVTVSERSDSDWNIYSLQLLSTRLGRSWPTVSTTVFYGLEIQGFQAWLDNSINYIEIGKEYTFRVNVTQATDVTLTWLLETSVNITETYDGVFTSASRSYTYNTTGEYDVSIYLSNFISLDSKTFTVYVLHNLDEVSFSVDSTLANTVVAAEFKFTLSAACQFPMGDVDFHIDFKHGTNASSLEHLNNTVAPLPHDYTFTHLFDTQGVYDVHAKSEHVLGDRDFYVTVNVWDSLEALNLTIQGQMTNVFVTNTTTTLEFTGYLSAGFQYSIDYGDGTSIVSNGTDIMYNPYALSAFDHVYTQPDVYTVTWMAWNNLYSRSESFTVIVQNEIKDFQAWLNNDISYIEVGQTYTFEANATHGTNMTIAWSLEPSVNTTDFIVGEFLSETISHLFSSPGTYEIAISVVNLVSSDSKAFTIHALYSLDCLSFTVDNSLANTTLAAVFSFNVPVSCNFPFGNVDFVIHFNHSTPQSFTEGLNTSLSLPHSIEKSHLFDTQGIYEIHATAENILGLKNFSLTVEVWDTLIPLRLDIKDNIRGNVFVTNTTTALEFVDVPNAGFEYTIDFGDLNSNDSDVSSSGTEILYELYNLTTFEHVYTEPNVYTVSWTAKNGHAPYDRSETFTIIVQNEIKDFQAWLDNTNSYIEVDELYTFKANTTRGTNVTIAWSMEPSVNSTDFIIGEFLLETFNYSFGSPGSYDIVVSVANLVSSDSATFTVYVLYSVDCLTFSVDKDPANTTLAAIFSFNLPSTCNFPIGNVDFYINFNHSTPMNFMEGLNATMPLPHNIDKSHLFDTQGIYEVYATAENILGQKQFSLVLEVWDTLLPLGLEVKNSVRDNIFATNTTVTLEFIDVPNAGFEYSIDYGDGTNHSSNSTDILYELYSLAPFEYVYTEPEIYRIVWTARNGHSPYDRQESDILIVQNEVKEFKAWLNNSIIYLAVGDTYLFEASGTQGTNVSVAWNFEPGETLNDSFPGEYTYSHKYYIYNTSGEYNISVTASNLVNSQTAYIFVIVIYYINSLTFNVDNRLGNTTHHSSFDFTFDGTTDLPMDLTNFTINYKYGNNVSETYVLGPSETLPYVLNYQQLFDIQGIYLVEGKAENILGQESFMINMSIWDTLDPLEFNFYQSNGKYITNTTTTLVFENVPNAGFEYEIDYGDGFSESSSGSEILYRLYNLTEFNHTYTLAGIYTIHWIAHNGHYRRDETFTVLIQNKVPSEGYSLEPIGLKYPWKNLQTMDIPVNITLNETVPLPTNATCVFNADDGAAQVTGLVYNESFFQHNHRYLHEGTFNSSLNCSNEVSWYVYAFNLCVEKYNASYLSVVFAHLVPLNVSDNVTVDFHIDNNGFALIPFDVLLDFDYGDGSYSRRRRSPVTYDSPMYQHLYTARGDYIVTVTVTAQVTNTTSVLVYDLRLGIMHFEYNYDIGFINTTEIVYTMYGVLGTSTTYTLDFADGTPDGVCSSADYSGCNVTHIFPYWGERTVQVVASNGTFIEIDEVFMTIDNPIVNLTFDILRSIAIPNGTIDINLVIEEFSPVLPFLNCRFSMGDPIKRDLLFDQQNVTFASPYYFLFQYIALGRHKIEAHCWNLINQTNLWIEIVVTNKDFLFTGSFDRQYSQRETPLRLSAMKDNEITNRLFVLASLDEKTRINVWHAENVTDTFPGRHSIIFPRGYLRDGTYLVILEVGFVEEPFNKIGEPTYCDFISPPPHAEIVGGRRRVSQSGEIAVDAETLSYDQVFAESFTLSFTWECKSYTGSTFDDIITAHEGNSPSYQNCTSSLTSAGVMSLTTVAGRWYAVTVTVENNRTLSASFTQYIRIKPTLDLSIICHINCLAKVAVTSNLQLVPQLSDNCDATFTWRLQKKSGTSYGSYISLDKTITETGNDKPSLTIIANSLDPGSWYLVTLDMIKDGSLYGPAYYEFVTNKPPKGGSCRVVPYDEYKIPEATELVNSTVTPTTIFSSVANKREYNLTCKDWLDEGFTEDTWTEDEPMYYFFFLQYGDHDDERQILYFDPGATSNLVTIQMGNIDNGYEATVVLRIADVFGDYVELRYSVISTPYLTTAQLLPMEDTVQKNTVEASISEFDDELLKANQSYDYRTLARKIQGIASVYNAVVLNTSTSITLTPDDLLTLGYKRTEDGKLIKWADYWSLIVEVVETTTQDYLIHTGEKYVMMLHHSITTWPTNRRMSIVAIETMSRALNATLAVVDYTNVTAAIKASECANVLAQQLASHVHDRTFPNTEEIKYASIALRDLIRNILSSLQTVLTPNLPVDPTVEEMRNYLLYIQIFKTEVEGTAPLSLQEQTFLAQKQLQKYYVAKHIKSEASKEALPFLQSALSHLTEMFSNMIQIGQLEMYLENDFIYISAEVTPAYQLIGTTVERPHAAIVLDDMIETHPEACNASAVTVKTTIFKHNPYFWGEWADRISSYVPRFDFDKAILIGDTIRYKLENHVIPDCIDKTPTYFEDDPNKMIYILFDRMYGDDDILLFIRPNATALVYQAYFNKDDKPSIEDKQYIYSTEINVDKWTYEDGYKVKISADEFSTTGKIWIALRPLLENSVDLSLLTKPFCANVTSVNCLAWVKDAADNYYWDRNMCKVSRDTSRAETVCDCQNPGPGQSLTVGTTFYVPPNKIDFFAVFVDTDPLGNASVLATVIAAFVAFLLFVPWAWRADLKDKYKWSYALLVDNDIADSYFYLLRVYTGIRHGSGTKSNVGFVLVGDDGDTGIRIMDDDSHVGFEAGSVRNFVLSTRQKLGDVVCLRIWHDDSGGNESAWFLNKILVTDLQMGKKYIFKCNQWLDYDRGDQKVDRAMTAQTADETRTVYEMAPYTAAENHLWLSVFLRPLNSNFTRVQRLACLLGLIYLTMIVCTLTLKTPDEVEGLTEVVIGPFRFSKENFLTSFISVSIVTPLIMIVAFLFKNAETEKDDNEYLSCCRKGYKKMNDKIKVDQSVLATDYIPPTRIVVRHFHFLPHFCAYVGWALLILIVGLATWLLMLFSADWKQEKSEIWMTTIFCAVLLSIFVVETIKVGIMIAVIALLCNKAYDPPEPYINVDKLKEISKRNSHFLTKGPFYMNYLNKPLLPSAEVLEKNHRKRISNHQILKIFYQLLAFGGVLYIVYMISFENRDPQSYTFKKHVEDMMGFDAVTDIDTYVNWLNGTFVEEFFFSKYFGSEFADGTYKSFTRDIANLRVGPARLRQLRIKRADCAGPLGEYLKSCYDRYADSRVQTSDYCIGWNEMPCSVSEKANYFTSAAWLYNSSAEVWGFPTMAEYNDYVGGGYFMKLDVNKDVSLRIFAELLNQGWIDRATRVVILEFTLYNVNANLFSYAKFVAEFPEVGGVIPYTDIQIFRLYTNSSTILFLQFIFVLLVLAATVYMLYEICSNGLTYLKQIWNWLDILALIMSYSTIGIFIFKLNILEKTIDLFHEDKNAYVSFENLAFYDFFANTTLGILVFLLSVRVSRILGYSGKINEMAAVITSSAKDLLGFCVIFGVTYFAYVQLGWMLFGRGTKKYRDLFHTYGTLTEAIVGKNRLGVIMTSEPMLAEFYYFTFVLFVLLTLATMAAAILNFSITNVKQESKQISAPNIIEVIFDKIGALITKLTDDGNKEGKGPRQKERRRSSSSELRDILTDFKHFLRDVKLESKEKYKVMK